MGLWLLLEPCLAAGRDSGRFQPGGAQLRNRNFGGDARFAKAFMILLPSIVGDLGIAGVFGLKTLP